MRLRDLLHGQVGEDPQQQHRPLVVGQRGAEPVDGLCADAEQGVVLDVAAEQLA